MVGPTGAKLALPTKADLETGVEPKRRSCCRACWPLWLAVLVVVIVLAVVLPVTLTRRHKDSYCSDHDNWKSGEPLSKCNKQYTHSVPSSSVPGGYGLIGGGTSRAASSGSGSSGTSSSGRGGGGGGTGQSIRRDLDTIFYSCEFVCLYKGHARADD